MSKSDTAKSPFHIIFTIITLFFVVLVFLRPFMRLFFPVKYISEIKNYSNIYNLDEHLIMAIISTESKFNKDAVSYKNARGLMQIKEDTALWCIEKFNLNSDCDFSMPQTNIQIGCVYLDYLTKKFGNTRTALAAYNAGEGNVSRWLKSQNTDTQLNSIPFTETKNYVDKVIKRTKIYRFLY